MCSVKVMLMWLLSSLLAVREEKWITLFLELINCLYCSGTAWIHWLGEWSCWQGSLDWLQAAVPGLGGALAQWAQVLVGGFLPASSTSSAVGRSTQPKRERRRLLGGCARA